MLFPGLNARETWDPERQSCRSEPEESDDVLSIAKGASLFRCMIDLWDPEKPEARKADEAWRASSLASLNGDHERPENSALAAIFFSSRSDGQAACAMLLID